MASIDLKFNKLIKTILEEGILYDDPNRIGTKRLEIPRYSFYHSFSDGFPAITSKQLAWKSIVGETLWILKGDTHIRYLEENKIPIWRGDAYNNYLRLSQNHDTPEVYNEFLSSISPSSPKSIVGELGRVYGYQLRKFGGEFDQLQRVVDIMRNNPLATKNDVTYINPNDNAKQALSPCHTGWSVIMRKDLSGFDLEFKMSSWDVFLGAPFNIAGYALIAKILEIWTGRKALGIYCTAHNVHIYEPHIEKAKLQISRSTETYSNCELERLSGFKMDMRNNIDSWLNSKSISDFKLKDYKSHDRIPAKMIAYSAPNS